MHSRRAAGGENLSRTRSKHLLRGRLDWSTPEARAFLASCDVIGASCHRMQCYLGQTWPVIIDYLPNGFYDYTGAFRPMTDADFAAKEHSCNDE